MQESAHARNVTAPAVWPAVLWAAVLFLADRATKLFFFSKSLNPGSSPLEQVVTLVHHENRGAIANLPVPQLAIIVATLAVIAIVMYGIWKSAAHGRRHKVIALGILLGGALGNLYDRVLQGYVFDWILLFGQSAINLADIAVVVGAIWYAWEQRRVP